MRPVISNETLQAMRTYHKKYGRYKPESDDLPVEFLILELLDDAQKNRKPQKH